MSYQDEWTEEDVYTAWPEIRDMVDAQYPPDENGNVDLPARREAFNDWTDSLCKDGIISDELYNEIEHPEGN